MADIRPWPTSARGVPACEAVLSQMLDVFVVRFLRPAVQVGVEPLVGVPTGKKANFGDLSLMIVSEFTLFASALLLRREAYRDDP